MKRIPLQLPDEYIASLAEHFHFDLDPDHLATRSGKAYIAEKAGFVSRISQGLTRSRNEFLASEYLKDPKIRQAYLLYFQTTNMLKVFQPFRELAVANFFDRPSINHLDLGTGTGAALWGLVSFLHGERKDITVRSIASDSLEENLSQVGNFSKVFLRHFVPMKTECSFVRYDLAKPSEIPARIRENAPYHLITMMNVLNELDEDGDRFFLETALSLLSRDGALVLIEPAARPESRGLLRFRDLAVSSGATIFSPCTRADGCPALVQENDWCHTEAHWERPAFIKAIDEIIGTLRLSLKSTYMVIRKNGMTLSDFFGKKDLYRVTSERFDEKGRKRAILCGENGRHEYIINTRDLSEINSGFAEVERYDLVRAANVEVREHDRRITELSPISIVLPNLGAR